MPLTPVIRIFLALAVFAIICGLLYAAAGS